MELVRVDDLKSLAKTSDKLFTSADTNTVKLFNYIEKLLENELIEMQNKGFTQKQLAQYIGRADNWKTIQEKINLKTNGFLKSLFSSYKSQISELKNVYNTDFNEADLEKLFGEMQKSFRVATDVNKLLSANSLQLELLQFGNVSMTFNTQIDTLISGMKDSFNKTFGQMKTILRTSQKATFNQIRQEYYKKLNIVDKKYIYIGPNDSLTRPFCNKYLNQIKSESEWRKLSNGQIGSAFDMQGGYNCRHMLLLVPPEKENKNDK